jgi:hypothetical protein
MVTVLPRFETRARTGLAALSCSFLMNFRSLSWYLHSG